MNEKYSIFCITDKIVQYTLPVSVQNLVDMDLVRKYIDKAQQAKPTQSTTVLKATYLTVQEVEEIIQKHTITSELVELTHDIRVNFEALLTVSELLTVTSNEIVDRSLKFVPISYICFNFKEDKVLINSGDPDSPIEQINSLNEWLSIIKPVRISYRLDLKVHEMLEAKRGFIIDPVEIKHVAKQPMQYTFTVRPENLTSIHFKTTLCTVCSKWDCLCSDDDLISAANDINDLGF